MRRLPVRAGDWPGHPKEGLPNAPFEEKHQTDTGDIKGEGLITGARHFQAVTQLQG